MKMKVEFVSYFSCCFHEMKSQSIKDNIAGKQIDMHFLVPNKWKPPDLKFDQINLFIFRSVIPLAPSYSNVFFSCFFFACDSTSNTALAIIFAGCLSLSSHRIQLLFLLWFKAFYVNGSNPYCEMCVFFFVWTLEHLKILNICSVCRLNVCYSNVRNSWHSHQLRMKYMFTWIQSNRKCCFVCWIQPIHMTRDNEITRLEYMFIRTHDKTLNFAVFFSIHQRIVYACECVFVRKLRYFAYTYGFFYLRSTVVLLFWF